MQLDGLGFSGVEGAGRGPSSITLDDLWQQNWPERQDLLIADHRFIGILEAMKLVILVKGSEVTALRV